MNRGTKKISVVDGKRRRQATYIGHGTEGEVYRLNRRWVVKIYYNADAQRIRKIHALIQKINSLPMKDRRFLKKHILFPKSVIKDGSGNEIGFKMRRLPKYFGPHYDIFYSNKLDYRNRLIFACQFARVLTVLHRNKMYIGDFNPNNFLCDIDGSFKMVDADTMDFTFAGKHYKCMAYFPETLPLSTYSRLLRLGNAYKTAADIQIFDETSDTFSFAYTVFRLLRGASPYAALPSDPDELTRRLRGICPIFSHQPGYEVPPFVVKPKYIGKKLNALFRRTFLENEHVNISLYYKALKKLCLRYKFRLLPVKRYNGKAF